MKTIIRVNVHTTSATIKVATVRKDGTEVGSRLGCLRQENLNWLQRVEKSAPSSLRDWAEQIVQQTLDDNPWPVEVVWE